MKYIFITLQLRKRSQILDASIALDGEDHLNSLSDEVVLRVFKFLPRKILVKCSLVCRYVTRLTTLPYWLHLIHK